MDDHMNYMYIDLSTRLTGILMHNRMCFSNYRQTHRDIRATLVEGDADDDCSVVVTLLRGAGGKISNSQVFLLQEGVLGLVERCYQKPFPALQDWDWR